ncbi:rodlin [Streptomyces eurythermus]|uniref:rodlin n=1 Tax=Streptomyces eurythermus TaxID=42237 RepID=UPI0036FCE9CA
MLKKAMVAAATAASVVGMAVAAAPQALAIGNDDGPTVANGNGARADWGNSSTEGAMSPQLSLVQGSLNKPCLALEDIQVPIINIVPINDVPILSDDLDQQCSDQSSNIKRDGALSHILEDLAVLSANGEG